MAGSYNHIARFDGFPDADAFVDQIEHLGDAYELAEEMYGMIWYLASQAFENAPYMVEQSRQHYQEGLEIAKRQNRA